MIVEDLFVSVEDSFFIVELTSVEWWSVGRSSKLAFAIFVALANMVLLTNSYLVCFHGPGPMHSLGKVNHLVECCLVMAFSF